MRFEPITIAFQHLVNPCEYNRLVMEQLKFEQKKTLGLLLFMARLRMLEKRSNRGYCRIFFDECMDPLLKGEESFGKYLVSLFEMHLNILTGDDPDDERAVDFSGPEFLEALEEVYRTQFAKNGTVVFRKRVRI